MTEVQLETTAGPQAVDGALAHESVGLQALTVRTEQRPDRGEDAEPLLLYHWESERGLLGVFDGSGGSGSGTVWTGRDGVARSGAWVGSRLARLGVESWFEAQDEGPAELEARLRQVLQALPGAKRSKLVSSVLRRLPTTAALVRYHVMGPERVWVQALWAGDSRAYLLGPEHGLQALTRDDTAETDALAQLTKDPPVTNVLCADQPFRLREHQQRQLGLPVVLLCATDGFFGYVQTPADFELHLLDTLGQAQTTGDWARLLAERVRGYTADDASLALAAIGYTDFVQLQEAFAARTNLIRDQLDARPAPDDALHRRWRLQMWELYQGGYEQLMPSLDGERSQA